ncbi:hypothetical protein GCM10010156_42510 [Planobispora rosea]|uniref:Uncharacterized protein n=1 Tax=Planobispora rosea TaxID=35762 RepID=A0A8J3WDF3_PLARO|nr:Rv3235 family protein [Planobispora rosea]GGS79321.1 hypothetical protein GCM10010156_42510 [Planobispora rosea]GIH85894.1 hypothetical protein Pro02_43020 [Planobispora rosea]
MSHPPRPVTLPRIVSLAPAEPAGDEPPPRDTPYVQGTLALAYDPESREPGPDDPDGSHARPLIWGPPGAVPDARRLRALGQAFAEILSGRRPPSTVSRQTTSQVQAELLRAGKVFDCPRPPMAGRLHLSQPRDGVVEMCVLVRCGERYRGLALRLERTGVQWLCTDFETTP